MEEGRLPGPVRPEQAGDPGAEAEADVVDGDDVAVPAGDPVEDDRLAGIDRGRCRCGHRRAAGLELGRHGVIRRNRRTITTSTMAISTVALIAKTHSGRSKKKYSSPRLRLNSRAFVPSITVFGLISTSQVPIPLDPIPITIPAIRPGRTKRAMIPAVAYARRGV